MGLSTVQHGVLRGMAIGVVATVALIVVGITLNPFGYTEFAPLSDRFAVAFKSSVLLAVFLALGVGRLARHRFFTPADIDGGGLSEGTPKVRSLQSELQNTLEQVVLAFLVYLSWAAVMPATWLSVVPLAAIAFAVGRVLFAMGYRSGAPSRAIGFTLTFYPSLGMLVCVLLACAWALLR